MYLCGMYRGLPSIPFFQKNIDERLSEIASFPGERAATWSVLTPRLSPDCIIICPRRLAKYLLLSTYVFNVQVHGSINVSFCSFAPTQTTAGVVFVKPKRVLLMFSDEILFQMYARLDSMKPAKFAKRKPTRAYNCSNVVSEHDKNAVCSFLLLSRWMENGTKTVCFLSAPFRTGMPQKCTIGFSTQAKVLQRSSPKPQRAMHYQRCTRIYGLHPSDN